MSSFVVAVSGGVDSVALLHMLQQLPDHELVVAHVDHGIREDSHEDAAFVEALARRYNLPFESTRYELGPNASEETAREARYAFLRQLTDKYNAKLVTAHHADDVVESIAINLHRGTGWRGVATHSAPVERPLLAYTKQQLRQYVHENNLEWREDSTNQDTKYLRNRIRRHVAGLPVEKKQALLKLRDSQRAYKREIEEEIKKLVGEGPLYSRYFFTHIPHQVAMECLHKVVGARLTRPQLRRALLAIKTSQAGKIYEAGNGVHLHFTSRNFALSLIK